jgi:hypothetical protein
MARATSRASRRPSVLCPHRPDAWSPVVECRRPNRAAAHGRRSGRPATVRSTSVAARRRNGPRWRPPRAHDPGQHSTSALTDTRSPTLLVAHCDSGRSYTDGRRPVVGIRPMEQWAAGWAQVFWSEMHQRAMELAVDVYGQGRCSSTPVLSLARGLVRCERHAVRLSAPPMMSALVPLRENLGRERVRSSAISSGERVPGLPKGPSRRGARNQREGACP